MYPTAPDQARYSPEVVVVAGVVQGVVYLGKKQGIPGSVFVPRAAAKQFGEAR